MLCQGLTRSDLIIIAKMAREETVSQNYRESRSLPRKGVCRPTRAQHLAVIAKQHIGQFVEHLQTMTQRGKPLTATTMSNYLVFSIE